MIWGLRIPRENARALEAISNEVRLTQAQLRGLVQQGNNGVLVEGLTGVGGGALPVPHNLLQLFFQGCEEGEIKGLIIAC